MHFAVGFGKIGTSIIGGTNAAFLCLDAAARPTP